MGSHHLRQDPTCENCGYKVEIVYCSNCGQKNVETRQSFAHLVSHFAEDFTHYDAAFWKTIKYLLFRPGRLTVEYLDGKRQRYVPPVKLYIFISFLAFLIPGLLPDAGKNTAGVNPGAGNAAENAKKGASPKVTTDVYENVWFPDIETNGDGKFIIENPLQYQSVQEMDSIEKRKPRELQLSSLERKLAERLIERYHHNTPREVGEKFGESFIHAVPKAIFLYMPVFGFWLWLLHGKRRWLFFDHGIFTLHYFAFLLLCTIIITLISFAMDCFGNKTLKDVLVLLILALVVYCIVYFYKAHRRLYRESKMVNFTKSSSLFFVNIISILIWCMIVSVYIYHNLH